MMGLILALDLKEIGLQWDPSIGDHYYHHGYLDSVSPFDCTRVSVLAASDHKNVIFAPRLDQLTQEIEKCGYWWSLSPSAHDGTKFKGYMIEICDVEYIGKEEESWHTIIEDTPEEVAAQALLWILKGAK